MDITHQIESPPVPEGLVRVKGRRRQWEDPDTGEVWRQCGRCREIRLLEEEFYVNKRDPDTREVLTYSHHCKECTRKRSKEYSEQIKERGGQELERMRVRHRESQKRWRESNPEAYAEQRKRYLERVKSDPRRHAEMCENRRMYIRLKREQEGRPIVKKGKPAKKASFGTPRLPAAPLGEFLRRRVDESGMSFNEYSVARLGISDKTLRSYISGYYEEVHLDAADKILTRLNVLWFEIWPPDIYPEAAIAFLGEAP